MESPVIAIAHWIAASAQSSIEQPGNHESRHGLEPATATGVRHEPIERRKAALAKLIRRAKTGLVLNDHIDEPGDVVFRHACKLRLERHRIEAPWLALPLRPVAALGQE